MTQLTKQQIERQDFVDNQIFALMQKLAPPPEQLEWDIEKIGAVREAIRKQVASEEGMSEMEFYPYLS